MPRARNAAHHRACAPRAHRRCLGSCEHGRFAVCSSLSGSGGMDRCCLHVEWCSARTIDQQPAHRPRAPTRRPAARAPLSRAPRYCDGASLLSPARPMRAALSLALGAALACTAGSAVPETQQSARRRLGDAAGTAVNELGGSYAEVRDRIDKSYQEHARTASSLWNMREARPPPQCQDMGTATAGSLCCGGWPKRAGSGPAPMQRGPSLPWPRQPTPPQADGRQQ